MKNKTPISKGKALRMECSHFFYRLFTFVVSMLFILFFTSPMMFMASATLLYVAFFLKIGAIGVAFYSMLKMWASIVMFRDILVNWRKEDTYYVEDLK